MGVFPGQEAVTVEVGGDAASIEGDEGKIPIGPFRSLGHFRGSCK